MLGCGEVALLRVHEISCNQVVDIELNRKVCVRLNGAKVFREQEFRAGHLCSGWDVTNGRRVAGTASDLQTIGDGFTNAKVDEVVYRR